jgi:hypothetical protein
MESLLSRLYDYYKFTGRDKMILPSFVLSSRVNQTWSYSGIDSLELCMDKKHFVSYPHDITYRYNSRGFRDAEWPNTLDQLKNVIWCVGDSFTVGIGSPLEHTWPWLLSATTGQRVINISMDGASNMWIARQVNLIQKEINPKNITIMWSYVHRREHENQNLTNEQRRLSAVDSTNSEDLLNLKYCLAMINHSNTIQLAIPEYRPNIVDYQPIWKNIRGMDWPTQAPTTLNELLALPEFVQSELKDHFKTWTDLQQAIEQQSLLSNLENNFIKVSRLDLARDGHHFDLVTSQWVVDQIVQRLN